MATISRKKKLKQRRARQLASREMKIAREREIQAQLGTQIFGYWQAPIDGYTPDEMLKRCVWFGDWNCATPPQGERRFIIEMFLYSTLDENLNRQIDLTSLELTCHFGQIHTAVCEHFREVEAENPHIIIDGRYSFCRVRT